MRKEQYTSLDQFKDTIKPTRYIVSNEGYIYITEHFVYKIFDSTNIDSYYCRKSNIVRISHLSREMVSVPISMVYIDKKFIGFKMFYCGKDLNNLFLEEKLSHDELISICHQLKEIELYLKRKRLVHGDIQLSNLLYQNTNLTLTDINGFIQVPNWYNFYRKYYLNCLGGDSLRIPGDYYFWAKLYGFLYLDYLSVNYCTFLLLNFEPSEIQRINENAHESKIYRKSERFVENAVNRAFEDDVYDYFTQAFTSSKKKILSDVYLIDHLK